MNGRPMIGNAIRTGERPAHGAEMSSRDDMDNVESHPWYSPFPSPWVDRRHREVINTARRGAANGDLFDAVVAFSPGFAAPLVVHGDPRVFVSHGSRDRVLPVDSCSRRLVPRLEALGYQVTYEEFDGAHEVPWPVVGRAVSWMPSGHV
jgi:acetyl esterase/lipase